MSKNKTGELSKACALSMLEYSITHLIKQYEIKYKVMVTGIGYDETGALRINWRETGQGVRTDKEVAHIQHAQLEAEINTITKKLAKQ